MSGRISVMPIEQMPDWERRLERQDAFWHGEIIDRPVVSIIIAKEVPVCCLPDKSFATQRERWMDADYAAESALACVMNTDYLGDALPHAFPNLGPDVFAAFLGVELEFGEATSWSHPIADNWDQITFREENLYWKKINELTDALLEIGQGKFYTGITDLHPGGDGVAAIRGPAELSMDLIESLDNVKRLLKCLEGIYFQISNSYMDKLASAQQAICNWAGIVSTKRWCVPSNDFSGMISREMFDEVFLPGIIEECKHYDSSIYHLDGPGALRHLDSLLEIPELNAIQWVYGAGSGRASDWMDVYRKCQAAGKGIQITVEPDELHVVIENLNPQGVWMNLLGVRNKDEAESLLDIVSRWQ